MDPRFAHGFLWLQNVWVQKNPVITKGLLQVLPGLSVAFLVNELSSLLLYVLPYS